MAFSGVSCQQKVLEKYKDKIAASLQHLDLPSFSKKLLESELIDQQTNESISSMDYDHVDMELCARYLLRKISDSIGKSDTTEGGSSCWDRFVRVLLDFSDPGETLNIIDLECMRESEVLDIAIIAKVKDENTDNRSNRRFKEADIGRLVKVLSKYSYEWEGISVALNIPKNVMEECRKGASNAINLYNVLHSWVMGNHSVANDPTYYNLWSVLQSPIVNCSAASQDLREEFYPRTAIHEQGDDSSSLTHQPSQTCVKFGASILLETKVSSSKPVASYTWNKDRKNLKHSRGVDICNNIICIQSVSDSGIYSCCTRLCNNTTETTCKKFYVRVILPERDKNLIDIYSKFEEVPIDSWPPISPIKFINIALITSRNNYINDTIKHGIDEILETKELVEYDEVFGKFTPGKLIFVEGRPGSGKTTLVHKVTRDWAKNLKGLKGAAKVYLVSLRVLNYTKKDKSLYDILSMFYLDSQDTTIALDEIKKTSGRDVCFIFDGLDEYTENNKENIVKKIIYKQVLPRAMVIVASRPVGTAEHRGKAPVNKRIEVLGFTKNNISEYINHYPFDTLCAPNLEKYLKVHHNVLHMCYLPVHASMICYLYKVLGNNIPNTETKIYEYFTCLTVVRKNKREENQKFEMTSLDDLQGDQKAYFNKISTLALDMTLKSIQVVSKSEVDIELDHEPGSDSPFLGLLVIDSVAEIFGYEEMYTFLHLTSQEFLTARYVASLECKQQIVKAKKLMQKKQYQTLKFYFGLVNAGSDIFKEFYHKFIMLNGNDVFWMQCAFESQNQSSCQFISNGILWGEELKLSQHHLLPLDFAAIGYVFSNSSEHVLNLSIKNCIFDDEGIRAFLSTIDSYKLLFIRRLEICSDKFPLKAINLLLLHLHNLEELVLSEDNFDDTDLKSIAEGVVLDRLRVLRSGLSIQDKDVAGLASFGSSCFQELHAYNYPSTRNRDRRSSSLTVSHLLHAHRKKVHIVKTFMIDNRLILCCLDFYEISFNNFLNCVSYSFFDCGIDDGAVAIIALSLIRSSSVKQLKCLKLDLNNITTFGALFVASILKYSSSIEEFSIFGNKVNCIGAEAIAESLEGCKRLRTVDMQLNAIGDTGAIAIAHSAAKSDIHSLYLCNSNVTEYGINEVLKYKQSGTVIRTPKLRIEKDVLKTYPQLLDKVSECYHSISKIRVIDIIEQKRHEIPEKFDQIRRIIEELKMYSSLTDLNLEKCLIGEQGAYILANEMKNCSKLELLNLSNNKLYSPGTVAVAGALKYCPKLEVLNMSANGFSSSECIAALADSLQHMTAIEELDFSYNCIGSDVSSVLVVDLSKLRKLNLTNCGIDSTSAKLLAEKLQHCSCLQGLSLQDNNMGSGMMDIVQALQSCRSLQHLNLIHTGIDADCMEVLAEGLKLNNQLQELCLAGNQFSQEAAEKLARSLCHCKLEQLHLQECCIDDKGAMALSEGLKHCKYLDYIDLSCNQIGMEGAFALARNLRFCTCLQTVFVTDNPIEDEGAIELYEQLKYVKNIYISEEKLKDITKSKLSEIQLRKAYPQIS